MTQVKPRLWKAGKKNQWRRWAWKQLRSRVIDLGIAPRDCTVVYLAGADDLDRPVAINNGFRFEKLIALSDDERVVKALKSMRPARPAFPGKLSEFLMGWPSGPEITGILADYCGGIGADSCNLIARLVRMRGAAVVNLQRGRAGDIGGDPAFRSIQIKNGTCLDRPTHRGRLYLATMISVVMGDRIFEQPLDVLSDGAIDLACLNLARALRPIGYEYKTGVWMDSVALTLPFEWCDLLSQIPTPLDDKALLSRLLEARRHAVAYKASLTARRYGPRRSE